MQISNTLNYLFDYFIVLQFIISESMGFVVGNASLFASFRGLRREVFICTGFVLFE